MPSPARHLVRVVLPGPLRPTRPMRSPLAIRKVADSMRTRAPARSSIPEAEITDRLQGGVVWRDGRLRTFPPSSARGEWPWAKSNGAVQPLFLCSGVGRAAGDLVAEGCEVRRDRARVVEGDELGRPGGGRAGPGEQQRADVTYGTRGFEGAARAR